MKRFMAKIHKSSELSHNGTPCWIWRGAVRAKSGYGSFGWQGGTIGAHQASHRLFKGDVPTGMDIDHLCRRRNCVNPQHLEAVTRSVNLKRGNTGWVLRAKNLSKTHCPQGHEYTPENTYTVPGKNSRACRLCKRILEKSKCTGRTVKTHCANGHEFTAENTYTSSQGWRSCMQCRRDSMARLLERRKAKA